MAPNHEMSQDRPIIVVTSTALIPGESTILRRKGLEAVVATTPRAIVHRLRAENARLLLLGPELAARAVDELCREIRGKTRLADVSIVVATDDRAFGRRLLAVGANGIVSFPIDAWELDETIARLLDVSSRAELRVSVELEVRGPGLVSHARSLDISASGILLETEQELALDSELALRFAPFGGGRDLEVAGLVVRRHSLGGGVERYGIRFLNLEAEVADAIRAFVAREKRERALRKALE